MDSRDGAKNQSRTTVIGKKKSASRRGHGMGSWERGQEVRVHWRSRGEPAKGRREISQEARREEGC